MIKVIYSGLKQRAAITAILLVICGFLIYYFHWVLGTGTVFTHFFYIPVILASLWWGKKGLYVAIFLALLLVLSHIFLRTDTPAANDYLRAVMLIAVSFAVAMLKERIDRSERRKEHLNLTLNAIFNASELIAREKNRDHLLKGICDNLTATHGYHNTWIALFNESGELDTYAESGLGENLLPLIEQLKRGELTSCGRQALEQTDVVITTDPVSTCTDCPLSSGYTGREALTVRLEHAGKVYGWMSASVPSFFITDEEIALFHRISFEIGFALHGIELEIERQRMAEALAGEKKRLEATLYSTGDGVITTDVEGRVVVVNKVAERLTGWPQKEAAGKPLGEVFNVIEEETRRSISGLVNKVRETGQSANIIDHAILIARDGTQQIIADSGAPIHDEHGNTIGVVLVFRDITKLRRAEKELYNSQEKFSRAFRSGPNIMAITSYPDGRYIDVNDSYVNFTGYTAEELIGRKSSDINIWVTAEDRDRMFKTLDEQGRVINETFNFRIKSGEIRTWLFSAELITIGDEPCLIGISSDITERKQAEEAVRRERDRAQKYLDIAGVILVVIGADQKVSLINRRGCDILGCGESEIIGKNWFDNFLPKRLRDEVKTVFSQSLAGEADLTEYFENPVLSRNGEERIIAWHNSILKDESGNITGILSSGENITESKQAEEALAAEAIHRRILIEQSSEGIVVLDQDGCVYESNQRFAEMLGYSPEETNHLRVWDWEFQYEPEVVLGMIRDIDEKGDHFETRHLRKDGSVYDVEISTNGAIFAGQKLIFCVCRDITERKKTERLQQDENTVLTLMEQGAELGEVLDAIIRLGEAHNPSIKGSIMLFDSSRQWLVQGSGPSLPEAYNASLRVGIPIGPNMGSCGTAAHLKKRVIVEDIANSRLFQVSPGAVQLANDNNLFASWSQPVISTDGALLGTIANYNDKVGGPDADSIRVLEWSAQIAAIAIQRKQSEEHIQALYNQEKALRQELESEMKKRVEFSRALVHELKTPLTPVIASIDTLASGLKEEPWISLVKNIERGAERLGERIDELLDIARGEAGVLKIYAKPIRPLPLLRQVAEEVAELVSRHGQSLVLDLPASLPVVRVDENRMRQVLLNLINNSVKYTTEGTEIILRARKRKDYLVVDIQDTGPGIDSEIQERIFDLYYRVEDDRQHFSGLGIGLTLCKNIVELHGGRIWVESEKGHGSTFSFSIPLEAPRKRVKHREANAS